MMTMIPMITLVCAIANKGEEYTVSIRDVYQAIAQGETGGCSDPQHAVGDNGASLGRYQIQKAYWRDSQEYDSSLLAFAYNEVTKDEVAETAIMAYWKRYAKVWTAEELCRLHNGGPSKRGTDDYWRKCYEILILKAQVAPHTPS